MPDVAPDTIMQIAMGFMAAKHLFAASGIGLFEALAAGPTTVEEIVESTHIPPRTLQISLAAMVSLGLIEKEAERYRNSDAARAYLAGLPGPDLRPMLRFWDQISYPLWQKIEDALRTGQGQAQFGRFDEHQQRIFSDGVDAFTAPVAAALAASYDFSRHRRVLDIGGGTGTFLAAVLQRYPDLAGTLFELPGACIVARQHLAEVPEGARIAVVEGDFFKDPLPEGHDALIVANTVHVLSEEHNVALLRSIRENVPGGTRLLLVDLWTNPARTEPPAATLMSGEFLVVSGEGQAYSERDLEAWLARTGWRRIEQLPLSGPTSLVVADAI